MTRARVWIGLAALVACGGAPKRVAWDAMTERQKMAYMDAVVVPKMRSVFMEYDPHKYPKMGCFPCHNRDRSAGWKMPNPELALDPSCIDAPAAAIYGDETSAAATARMNAFMRRRVVPEMAALLGRPYDPAANGSTPCFGCHTLERPEILLPTVPPNPNPE